MLVIFYYFVCIRICFYKLVSAYEMRTIDWSSDVCSSDLGVPANRARTIPGAALDVLPRLTDGHYDLVCCDGDKREYADYLKEALRLLRPGGVVAFDNALWHDRVADPAQQLGSAAFRERMCQYG